jgi:tRNA-guanine transglycosylase
MQKFGFTITHTDKTSKARTGVIRTGHGTIRTPGFVAVGTAATVKTLTPEEIKACNIDVFFVNTYHMMFRPGMEIIKKAKGVHKFMNWDRNIMTDSGGFQAFSLGENGPRNKPTLLDSDTETSKLESLVKITEDGIHFTSAWDGSKLFLGPKESIEIQQALGSDIMMAFDECTFYPIKKERAQEALRRTHEWAVKSVDQHRKNTKKINPSQALYAVVQGSVFEDLRIESANFLKSLDTEGFAIGSVANAQEPREYVFKVLDWTLPILRETQKPVHFLGIGEIEDIFESVERGIDTLDCVTPTRMGRVGYAFSKESGLKNKFRYDVTKSVFAQDQSPLADKCKCYTCTHYTRSYINHLFRARELLAYRLTTIHNLTFFGNMMEEIRTAILEDRFMKLKKEWLAP